MKRTAIVLIFLIPVLIPTVIQAGIMESIRRMAEIENRERNSDFQPTLNFAETGRSKWTGTLILGGRETTFSLDLAKAPPSDQGIHSGLMMISDPLDPRGFRLASARLSLAGGIATLESTDLGTGARETYTGAFQRDSWRVSDRFSRGDRVGVWQIRRVE